MLEYRRRRQSVGPPAACSDTVPEAAVPEAATALAATAASVALAPSLGAAATPGAAYLLYSDGDVRLAQAVRQSASAAAGPSPNCPDSSGLAPRTSDGLRSISIGIYSQLILCTSPPEWPCGSLMVQWTDSPTICSASNALRREGSVNCVSVPFRGSTRIPHSCSYPESVPLPFLAS